MTTYIVVFFVPDLVVSEGTCLIIVAIFQNYHVKMVCLIYMYMVSILWKKIFFSSQVPIYINLSDMYNTSGLYLEQSKHFENKNNDSYNYLMLFKVNQM